MLLIMQCGIVYVSAADDLQATNNASAAFGCHTIDAKLPLLGNDPIIENAEAAILYEYSSETLMYTLNADEKVEPASLVKIMTALIAVEDGNLTDAVTVKKTVLDTIPSDAVSIGLVENEVLTVEDLLYCMMVASGNDAAAVVADHIAGSQAQFVERMNLRASELGCTATKFTNVHGLYDASQYTTARDIARILSAALKNESFTNIFNTVSYTVPATNHSDPRKLTSGNFLINGEVPIYQDERVTGGRTGVSSSGKRCIAAAAESGDMKYLTVVIGSADIYSEYSYTVKTFGGYKETSQLLDKGTEGFKVSQIVYADQAIEQRTVLNGDAELVLGAKESVFSVLPQTVFLSDLDYRFSNATDTLTAPVRQDDVISVLEIWHENMCIAQVELYAMNSVSTLGQKLTLKTATEKPATNWPAGLTVIVITVTAIIALFVVIRLVGRIRRVSAAKNRRRHMRNRRRSK